jgi:uncharacterized protein
MAHALRHGNAMISSLRIHERAARRTGRCVIRRTDIHIWRAGERRPGLIEPGRPYEYAIDLWATSNVFKAGHRIGLHVTSSCFPRWDRNPNTGHGFGADAEMRVARQLILHDREHPSRVVMPVAGPA